jgi:hypothetical protein
MRPLLILFVLAATPGAARAGDDFRIGNPQPAVALGIGPTLALGSVATGGGVHLEALTRLFPETLGGIEVDTMLIGTNTDELPRAAGRSVRAGAKLRQSLMGWGPMSFGGELAATLGFGWEQIDWNRGGRLRRTQFSIGVEDGLVLNRRHAGRDRYAGFAFSCRGMFSRASGEGWSGAVLLDFIIRASP